MADKTLRLAVGTLDFLVLTTLRLEPLHGYGIQQRLVQVTQGTLLINGGSLFTALYRLDRQGLLAAKWRNSDSGPRAKFHSFTPPAADIGVPIEASVESIHQPAEGCEL